MTFDAKSSAAIAVLASVTIATAAHIIEVFIDISDEHLSRLHFAIYLDSYGATLFRAFIPVKTCLASK
jgi:hypothetical protein